MSSTIDRRPIFCGRLAVAADLLVAAILAVAPAAFGSFGEQTTG